MLSVMFKTFHKILEMGILPSLFYEAPIIPIPKSDKNSIRKLLTNISINICIKTLTK